jgi:hypothetical protein
MLPEMDREPLFVPVDVGANSTKISQNPPGATAPQQKMPGELGDGQVTSWKSPDTWTCVIFSGLLPVLVTVTLWYGLADPTCIDPNANDDGWS